MKKITIALLLFCNISLLSYAQRIKPYNEVITSEAITKKGFFKVHQLDNKLYFEIPTTLLNKDLLFVKFRGDYKQVKWVKEGHTIQLIIPPIKSQVGDIIPIKKILGPFAGSNYRASIMAGSFPILAEGNMGSSYVIDATNLFLNPPKGLPGHGKIIVSGVAHIDKILAVDNTIEVQTKKTITSEMGPRPVIDNFSMVLLPEPMKTRLWDFRMGFAKETATSDYEIGRAAIRRWRLEKKNPDQPLSDPITPITLYFDPAVPAKWKPYIKSGIEQWLPAFEAAGFKNAIEVKEPPIHDKNWSLNSTRYSYIRWYGSEKYRGKKRRGVASANKFIIDNRSGEIITGSIKYSSNVYRWLSDSYFVRCAPLDSRAHQYPFPDDLMGELIEYITAHEAGHIFGLIDGHYGEYAYPFEKMRDKSWLQNMGHTPSVMSYTRHNFVVQPKDSIPPQLLLQKMGPTDLYSIRWGYTPFKGIHTLDDELPYLDSIIKEQDTIPWYTFFTNETRYKGPQGTNEVVECDDPVKATKLGIQNLKRVLQLIPSVTKNERSTKLKKRLYTKTLDLWTKQMELVVSLVGGYTMKHQSTGQGVLECNPIPANQQKEAIAFLNKEVFQPPLWLAPQDLINSFSGFEHITFLNRSIDIITKRQKRVLKDLLNRLKYLQEIDFTTQNSYPMVVLFQDLSSGLFEELKAEDIKINPYRQEIQMAYIISLTKLFTRENSSPSASSKYKSSIYIRGIIYDALHALKNNIEDALKKVKAPATQTYLKLYLLEIDKAQIFNP